MKIRPARSLRGSISLPGDKSISHRAAMIASIADGKSHIENFSTGEDCASTIRCMRQLGVRVEHDYTSVIVHGVGKSGLQKPNQPLDCGNSGTTMRLLTGIMAGQNFESELIGDESLQKRPMNRIVYPLKKMGSRIKTNYGKAPLSISGKSPLQAIEYFQVTASAQIKSCILFAGLNSDGETTVIEPIQTRDHTERMLRWFGVPVSTNKTSNGMRITVSGDATLMARDLVIPSDVSSAAFFLVAAACLKGSDITMPNVGLNPSRRAIYDTLLGLGANIEALEPSKAGNEPSASLRVLGGLRNLGSTPPVLGGKIIANLIDEIPILAILGTQMECGIEVRDAAELRVKESDRIAAIVENLRRMGANVTEFDDGFKVEKSALKGEAVDSFGDHRIAMAFAVAALLARGETEIIGAKCADISFPGFFDTLAAVVS